MYQAYHRNVKMPMCGEFLKEKVFFFAQLPPIAIQHTDIKQLAVHMFLAAKN
jgi:hypothetical protein